MNIRQPWCFRFLCGMMYLAFFIACRPEHKNGESNVAQIVLSASDTSGKQSDWFDLDEVICLETTDSSLLGGVSAIIAKHSGFYILDKTGEQVVKFDTCGKFLYAINRKGRAPGEYLSLYGISVDVEDRYLYIYDGKQQNVLCYDTDKGKYVRHFRLEHSAGSFSVLPDGKHFIFYCDFLTNKSLEKEGCYPNLVITDDQGRVVKSFAYFDKKIDSQNVTGIGNGLFTNSGCDSVLLCFTQFQDILYKIDQKQGVGSAYILDYMNDNQTKNDRLLQRIAEYDRVDFQRNAEDKNMEGVFCLMKLNFTDRFIYLAGTCKKKMFFFLYDKKLLKTIDVAALEKDVMGNEIFFSTADRDCFYIHVTVSVLKRSMGRAREEYDPKIVNKAKCLDDEANPVLIKLKMKDK